MEFDLLCSIHNTFVSSYISNILLVSATYTYSVLSLVKYLNFGLNSINKKSTYGAVQVHRFNTKKFILWLRKKTGFSSIAANRFQRFFLFHPNSHKYKQKIVQSVFGCLVRKVVRFGVVL